MLAKSMLDLHQDIAEGDAYLHNDPYLGNTHAADHTIVVPVFVEGELMFTACAKAHQADIGNSIPTTYHAWAKDVYEEGALIFPCVRVQRGYEMINDVVRMCRSRIRVPDQWHGDFLAGIGAARVAERRLKELCAKYGKERIKSFIRNWFDYSERKLAAAIGKLPAVTLSHTGHHDPINPNLPGGVQITAKIVVDPAAAIVEIDLRDNVDCLDCGLNVSEACTINHAISGVLNSLDSDIPTNAGSFRRFRILIRDGAVLGRPDFPHSCSLGTTNVGCRLVNCVQSAFAQLGEGFGLAEGGTSMSAGWGVISGKDFRRDGYSYINQLFITNAGGPASPVADGWINYGAPSGGGLLYRDSVELTEIKQPMEVRSVRVNAAVGGAGKFRGAPGSEVIYGPKKDPMVVAIACDGQVYAPKGVRGGEDGNLAETHKIHRDGRREKLENFAHFELQAGEWVRGVDNGGGGYGHPFDRDPARVLRDVIEGWETRQRAETLYGVAFTGSREEETLAIDPAKTKKLRQCREAQATG
jgi:N-methylhydantoinase B